MWPGFTVFIQFCNSAEKLGLPSSPPYLSLPSNSNNTQAFLNGLNFASGGAGVLDSTNQHQCLTFSMQIDYYSSVYTALVKQLGSTQILDHLSKSIFSFTIGSNDILHYTRTGIFTDESKITPGELVDSMISSLRGKLKMLYNLGARKFAFLSTGPIGCCPAQRTQNKTTGDCNILANSISLQYSEGAAALLQEMKSENSDMNYSFFNVTTSVLEYIEKPTAFGFTEVKAGCCGRGQLNGKFPCMPFSKLCPNRSNYLFWDLYHPSETTTGLLSTTFFEGSSPYVYPLNVKQLSGL